MKTTIYRLIIVGMIASSLIACIQHQEHVYGSTQVVEEDMGDVIYKNSTIIIQPSQAQSDSLQKKADSSVFSASQDDYVFYANAMTGFFMDKDVVNYTFTGVRSLNYKNAEGKIVKYDLEQNGALWQLYFYSPEKGFRRIEFSNYESEFEKFFNQ